MTESPSDGEVIDAQSADLVAIDAANQREDLERLIGIDVQDDQQARAGDQPELDAVEEHSHERRAAPRDDADGKRREGVLHEGLCLTSSSRRESFTPETGPKRAPGKFCESPVWNRTAAKPTEITDQGGPRAAAPPRAREGLKTVRLHRQNLPENWAAGISR